MNALALRGATREGSALAFFGQLAKYLNRIGKRAEKSKPSDWEKYDVKYPNKPHSVRSVTLNAGFRRSGNHSAGNVHPASPMIKVQGG
ncbi:hypothetical protein [Sinorhizobium fredii]|nr:hypothetical protein [Sinorhizobium fredii]